MSGLCCGDFIDGSFCPFIGWELKGDILFPATSPFSRMLAPHSFVLQPESRPFLELLSVIWRMAFQFTYIILYRSDLSLNWYFLKYVLLWVILFETSLHDPNDLLFSTYCVLTVFKNSFFHIQMSKLSPVSFNIITYYLLIYWEEITRVKFDKTTKIIIIRWIFYNRGIV